MGTNFSQDSTAKSSPINGQWRGFGMDLGAKFSQGEVIEGGHIGQDKRLRWGHLG